MSKATSPDEWSELMYMYEDDKSAAEYVLDQALDLLEEISEHVMDGRYYASKMLLVKTGDPLPTLYQNIRVKTMLTETAEVYKVMGIHEVKWGADGIVVGFYGKKVQPDDDSLF